MKNKYLPLAILFIAAAGWVMWISFINTRTTITEVLVSGLIDEVVIYRTTNPDEPILRIETKGQDTTRFVELQTAERFNLFTQSRPAKYFFAARAGNQTHRGSVFCCETGIHPVNGMLTIDGLSNWSFSDEK